MVQRLTGDPGGQVRHQGDPEHLDAGGAGGDRLVDRRHADQPRPHGAQHVDLRRGLVLRSRHHRVHRLAHPRTQASDHVAQPRRVGVHQVHEIGADQRGARGHVQVVADQHRLADAHALGQPAGGIGQHHRGYPGGRGGADRMRGPPQGVALVGVGASQQDEDIQPTDPQTPDRPAVALGGRGKETGQVRHGELSELRQAVRPVCPFHTVPRTQDIGGRTPPRAQDNSHVMVVTPGAFSQFGGSAVRQFRHGKVSVSHGSQHRPARVAGWPNPSGWERDRHRGRSLGHKVASMNWQ